MIYVFKILVIMPPKASLVKPSSSPSKKEEKTYIDDLSQHEQILLRPDTYIGTVSSKQLEVWINGIDQFLKINIDYIDGLMRTWIEPSSNAIDNLWRSQISKQTMTYIRYTINPTTGECSVTNDGQAMPVRQQVYKQTGELLWVPEIALGKLLTSTNYNDEEKRLTSGRNGYGAKLTNIFSTVFTVEVYDEEVDKHYIQTWKNNMKDKQPPIITSSASKKSASKSLKKSFTKVSWIPDFKYFTIIRDEKDNDELNVSLLTKLENKMKKIRSEEDENVKRKKLSKTKCTNFTDGMIKYIERLIYFTASYVYDYGVKVYYNEELIDIKGLKDYALRFYPITMRNPEEILQLKTKECTIVLLPSLDNNYNLHCSVNGIETTGGSHVIPWEEVLFEPVRDHINGTTKIKQLKGDEKKKAQKEKEKKDSKPQITVDTVKKKLSLFVSATLYNPRFDTQNKRILEEPIVEPEIKKITIATVT